MNTNILKDYHHYKGDELTKFEKVERKVIEIIRTTKVPDSKREDSITFELKHAAGCTQIARILAQKRNLNVAIADTAATLHDIHVIVTGTYANHGPLGAVVALQILNEIGGFTPKEKRTICEAVTHHSEKEIYSDNPYIELVKDVDVFDCSLYVGAEGFYRIHKPEKIFNEYVKRIKKVRIELGLPPENIFR